MRKIIITIIAIFCLGVNSSAMEIEPIILGVGEQVPASVYQSHVKDLPEGAGVVALKPITTEAPKSGEVEVAIAIPEGGFKNITIPYIVGGGSLEQAPNITNRDIKKIVLQKGEIVVPDIYQRHIKRLPVGSVVVPTEQITTEEKKSGEIEVDIFFPTGDSMGIEMPYLVK